MARARYGGQTVTTSSEVFSAAMRGEQCTVTGFGENAMPIPMQRWSSEASLSDMVVLGHCDGVTLDVGCGPGRMTTALATQGVCSLGIDVVPEAVAQTLARGGNAMLRDVFGRLPGEGRWDCALLADGNIGIGGNPVALLRRVADLVHARGKVIVDLARPGAGLMIRTLRLHAAIGISDPFDWSVVAPEALPSVAQMAGLEVAAVKEHGSRWFAILEKSERSCQ